MHAHAETTLYFRQSPHTARFAIMAMYCGEGERRPSRGEDSRGPKSCRVFCEGKELNLQRPRATRRRMHVHYAVYTRVDWSIHTVKACELGK